MFVPDDRKFLNNQTVLAASQKVGLQEVWSSQTIVATEFSHPKPGHPIFQLWRQPRDDVRRSVVVVRAGAGVPDVGVRAAQGERQALGCERLMRRSIV